MCNMKNKVIRLFYIIYKIKIVKMQAYIKYLVNTS